MAYKTSKAKREYQKKYAAANKKRTKKVRRKWYAVNIEKEKKRRRKYYIANREKEIERVKKYRTANPEKHLERCRKYKAANIEHMKEYGKKYRKTIRDLVFKHYSNGSFKCTNCGYAIHEGLALDHVNGGGNKHRKELKLEGGIAYYKWIIENKFPKGFQVLCHNCNFLKSNYPETYKEIGAKNKTSDLSTTPDS